MGQLELWDVDLDLDLDLDQDLSNCIASDCCQESKQVFKAGTCSPHSSLSQGNQNEMNHAVARGRSVFACISLSLSLYHTLHGLYLVVDLNAR